MKQVKQVIFRYAYLLTCAALGLFTLSATAQDSGFTSPEIVVLGDSQLTFGGGPVFLDFFRNLPERCAAHTSSNLIHDHFDRGTVAIIGVRSTSLHSWAAAEGASKGAVCDIDPKWNVNASIFGDVDYGNRDYVQIGQGANYDFCEPEKTPFQVMLRDGYYQPELLVLSFLGNAAERWAKNLDAARQDVAYTTAQLPADMPCIFMSTAPAYRQSTIDLRSQAQNNIKQAFTEAGNRCSFVEGHTDKTIASNLGNAQFFRRKSNGEVKDPYHPNQSAQRRFLELIAPQICRAAEEQLRRHH